MNTVICSHMREMSLSVTSLSTELLTKFMNTLVTSLLFHICYASVCSQVMTNDIFNVQIQLCEMNGIYLKNLRIKTYFSCYFHLL